MRQILPMESTAEKLCGTQRLNAGAEYRHTFHSLSIPCKDGTLLYHTMTGELLLLAPDETEEQNRDALIRGWFLVPKDFDENRHVRDVREILSLLHAKKGFRDNFTIFTTTDCNARCYYCYEKGIDRFSMTAETARDTAAYIARISDGHEVKLSWIGGEPLFNSSVIDIICDELRRLGVRWWSIMTSNGYYFTDEIAKRANDLWNMRRVQITLDGTREVYLRTKSFIEHDADAYERVLRNMSSALSAGVKVTIRLNMDAGNADDLLVLSNELYTRFGKREDLDVMPVLLQPWAGAIRSFDSEQETICRYFELQDRLKELGLLRSTSLSRTLFFNHCIADNDACETILPDGRIGKCDQFQGTDLIGSIYSEEKDQKMILSWKEKAYFTECERCPLYPRCVQLKKCNWVKRGCAESNRTVLIRKLEQQIMEAYNSVKQSNNTNGEN